MNKNIQNIVEQLNDKDTFIFELSQLVGRAMGTINTHWLKKDGYQIPDRFQLESLRLAFRLKKKQDKEIKDISVNL